MSTLWTLRTPPNCPTRVMEVVDDKEEEEERVVDKEIKTKTPPPFPGRISSIVAPVLKSPDIKLWTNNI